MQYNTMIDSIVSFGISMGIGVFAGLLSGVKQYKDYKSKIKIKDRLTALEEQAKRNQQNEPVNDTPMSIDLYQKPDSNIPYV